MQADLVRRKPGMVGNDVWGACKRNMEGGRQIGERVWRMQKIGGNKRYGEGTGYTLLYSFSF